VARVASDDQRLKKENILGFLRSYSMTFPILVCIVFIPIEPGAILQRVESRHRFSIRLTYTFRKLANISNERVDAVSSKIVDAFSPKPGDLVLPLASAQESAGVLRPQPPTADLPLTLVQDLWVSAKADNLGLTIEEFTDTLLSVGAKVNYGLPVGDYPDAGQKAAFLRSLHLEELALARSCALGYDAAWKRFFHLYRAPLTQAAIAITGSTTLGNELADSLYSELYGLRTVDGARRCPLMSYSGRGSLLGWLRTTLAQRHVDHHRRTHRETALSANEAAAAEQVSSPAPAELAQLADAVCRAIGALPPEDRFLLSSYFLDRSTLLNISRVLQVHEATVSRRIKRLVADLRRQLLKNLQASGISKGAAEKVMGSDPRDVEINLRSLLQTSQTAPFSEQTESQR
jgi:RNA polymerase sigma-70 factor, ECF subfamily